MKLKKKINKLELKCLIKRMILLKNRKQIKSIQMKINKVQLA